MSPLIPELYLWVESKICLQLRSGSFADRLRIEGAALENIVDPKGHRSLTMTRHCATFDSHRFEEVVPFLGATRARTEAEQSSEVVATAQAGRHKNNSAIA